MNLTISGHHVEVTPPIRAYVQSKLDRIKRNFENVIDITVVLGVENISEKEKRQKAEINLNMSGKTLHAESVAQDLYAAIDMLIDKLDRQIVKHKRKLKEHNHDSVKKMPEPSEADAA